MCNRIDQGTSGIVLIGKTSEALRVLNEKIRLGEFKRYYLCVVEGEPAKKEGVLKDYLSKNKKNFHMDVVAEDTPEAKESITRYRVLSTKENTSLLEVELLTGHTHQIRRQLAHLGHPLLEDGKYGNRKITKAAPISRQLLCACKVYFPFTEPFTPLDNIEECTFEVDAVPFANSFDIYI